jgi:hypothetical protein
MTHLFFTLVLGATYLRVGTSCKSENSTTPEPAIEPGGGGYRTIRATSKPNQRADFPLESELKELARMISGNFKSSSKKSDGTLIELETDEESSSGTDDDSLSEASDLVASELGEDEVGKDSGDERLLESDDAKYEMFLNALSAILNNSKEVNQTESTQSPRSPESD